MLAPHAQAQFLTPAEFFQTAKATPTRRFMSTGVYSQQRDRCRRRLDVRILRTAAHTFEDELLRVKKIKPNSNCHHPTLSRLERELCGFTLEAQVSSQPFGSGAFVHQSSRVG
jgi:hypothetical protein